MTAPIKKLTLVRQTIKSIRVQTDVRTGKNTISCASSTTNPSDVSTFGSAGTPSATSHAIEQ